MRLIVPPSQLTSTAGALHRSFIGGEKNGAWLEDQHSEWRVSIHAPKGLAHYSSPFAAKWCVLLALCSLTDSRRSAPARAGVERDKQLQHRASKATRL